MHYDFPIINTIDDVLPHIEGRDEFNVMYKDGYTVINYMVAFEETFSWDSNDPVGSSIRRECRGLIFDTATGNFISRPYHKFFNVGERDETQLNNVDLTKPHVVLEKLDGSMIRPIPTKEGFRLATKAGITEVAMNAEVFIDDKPKYARFIEYLISESYCTPIFEWVSRKNRIVVDYPEDNLILTSIRYTTSGEYFSYEEICKCARTWNIPVVKAIAGDETDITKIVEHIRKWDDGEGVVIRFEDGHMVKIKADDYVLRHKTKEQINQEKNVIAIILNDSVDDLVPLLTETDSTRLKDFQHAFWISIEDVATDIYDLYKSIDNGQSQKDFALYAVPSVLPKYQPFMFQLRAGKPIKELIVNKLSKSLSTQTKVNENRWLFGGISWN